MTFNQNATWFVGMPVEDWPPDGAPDPDAIYRIRMSWDERQKKLNWSDKFATYLESEHARQTPGLVVGIWDYEGGSSEVAVEALVAARDELPHLTALFLGDIIYEENEVSWIENSDVSPIFTAYPGLTHFRVRGANGLRFGALRHAALETLIVESGGLGANIVREIAAARLPQLEHLELWLGTPNYGGDATVADLAPILAGERFPRLRYLGLRDSAMADQVAAAVAEAPILDRVRVLDLSQGTLGDEGAAALLASDKVRRLERLILFHHYCTDAMMEKLRAMPLPVDLREQQEPDEWNGEEHRYVAVSE